LHSRLDEEIFSFGAFGDDSHGYTVPRSGAIRDAYAGSKLHPYTFLFFMYLNRSRSKTYTLE